ncbi:MAG: DUF2075 domain-containing protein [Phycisphaerales bacterium]
MTWLSFVGTSPNEVFGQLVRGANRSGFSADSEQVQAWESYIEPVQRELRELMRSDASLESAGILLEYEIPRRGKRIDVVLLIGDQILVIEFKTSEGQTATALQQADDYALDIRDFHAASRDRGVHAVVVVSRGLAEPNPVEFDGRPILTCGLASLAAAVRSFQFGQSAQINVSEWDHSAYDPTPTVIEATCELFRNHTVDDINRSSADNLDLTLNAIREIASRCRSEGQYGICFVTGVPGSGKTLVGLASVHSGGAGIKGAFLSGNGPLVAVLREAVSRDAKERLGTKKKAARYAATMIQNVHQFIDEYGIKQPDHTPPEHVIVFDEAQRAWHAEKMIKQRREQLDSEPALTLDAMSRHADWCLIVALIGGGQEIHDGEAGLREWGRAISTASKPWTVYASPRVLRDRANNQTFTLFDAPANVSVNREDALHLETVIRSPRATMLSEWVDAVLSGNPERARGLLDQRLGYRIGLTRSLDTARHWLRRSARDEMRPGLIASSGAARLRAYGLEMDTAFQRNFDVPRWFLDPPTDIRSSHSLEVAMTEFSCQGLEIDFTGVCWGGDLLRTSVGWDHRAFKGSRWTQLRGDTKQRYLINKYRVLLTRGREGMVVWVPDGDDSDPTRDPIALNRTAEYLQACGLPMVADADFP